eukprot:TRINITY_DN111442_c0_g1_i1.p1 TRINITY_DN111442_c0_g1~~TRINITY_DN111442_c0_g1_i1.p1  ORF type:complete len:212 (+),score=70.56 TRINITY_DN111442_c0_g1_i1:112-747(+)
MAHKLAVALLLAVSAAAEPIESCESGETCDLDLEEVADMKTSLLQKAKSKESKEAVQAHEFSDAEGEAKMHVSESTFASLLESEAEELAKWWNPRRRATTTQPPGSEGGVAGCDNTYDKNIWWKKSGRTLLGSDMNKCSNQCWGGQSCVKKCMTKARGYSGKCADCHGKLSSCTASSCMFQCMGGGKPCEDCVQKNCRPAWLTCMGNMNNR